MIHPLFSYKYIDKAILGIKGNSRMNVGTIAQMRKPTSDELCFVMMFKSGKRELTENKNYSEWNGCSFEDVDYKNWLASDNDFKPEPHEVFKNVHNYLCINCKNYYYGETSKSGKGFHFLFFLNTEYPSEDRAKYINRLSKAWIIKAFNECGYCDIIKYPKVHDRCTNTIFQACHLTLNNARINDRCEPDKPDVGAVFDIFKIIEFRDKKFEKKETHTDINNDYMPVLIEVFEPENVEYIDHLERRSLFLSLSRLYKGEDLEKQWIRCADMIPENDRHTQEYYEQAPYKKCDWNKNLTGDEYCNEDLLLKFGYRISFIKDEKDKITNIFN